MVAVPEDSMDGDEVEVAAVSVVDMILMFDPLVGVILSEMGEIKRSPQAHLWAQIDQQPIV